MDSWQELKDALTQRVAEVQRATYLCIEERSKHQFTQELMGLDVSLRALEEQVQELKQRLQREEQTIPKVEALLQACRLQEADLQHMASNLPTHLPQLHAQPSECSSHASDDIKHGRSHASSDQQQPGAAGKQQQQQQSGQQQQQQKPRADTGLATAPAPRWYISETELGRVASYMRGRLTQDKVNTALEELAGFADANTKLLATARAPAAAAKLPPAARRKATELLHSVVVREEARGRSWLLESDLKEGTHIKLDKTGRAILTLLRHLGRLAEVRCSIEGVTNTVYVLQQPS